MYSHGYVPFGLINAGPHSKEPYDFSDFLNKVIMVYQDDLTIYSKCRGDHFMHPRKIFDRNKSFGISLNPKKFVFGVVKGKLLGHLVYKDKKKIDPARV